MKVFTCPCGDKNIFLTNWSINLYRHIFWIFKNEFYIWRRVFTCSCGYQYSS